MLPLRIHSRHVESTDALSLFNKEKVDLFPKKPTPESNWMFALCRLTSEKVKCKILLEERYKKKSQTRIYTFIWFELRPWCEYQAMTSTRKNPRHSFKSQKQFGKARVGHNTLEVRHADFFNLFRLVREILLRFKPTECASTLDLPQT